MPRRLKRRSDAISRDQSDSEPEPPPRRRATTPSESVRGSSASAPSSPSDPGQSTDTILIKKLVRLALATEYSRTPLRRGDISQKIFKDANTSGGRASFKNVFEGAQRVLGDVFGMQLMELPSREKTTLKDRRIQATQTKSSSNNSSKSWILVSTLPPELKQNPIIAQPTRAPNVDVESSYTGIYTFILALIYLNNRVLTDQKLERLLKCVNADTYTPLGNKEKLLQRMMKEGYIEKRRDTSTGEEVIEWTPGPRGKIEVGVEGVLGLVRSVYGFGAVPLSRGSRPNNERRRGGEDEDEDRNEEDANSEEAGRLVKILEDELNAKLSRSLGVKIVGGGVVKQSRRGGGQDAEDTGGDEKVDEDEPPGPSRRGGQRSRPSTSSRDQGRGGGRSNAREDDDEDDEW